MLRVLAQSNALQRNDYAGFHELASRVVASDPHWENIQLISVSGEQLLDVRVPYDTALPPLNRPDLPLKAVPSLAQWTVVPFMPEASSPMVRLAWQSWCAAAVVRLGAAWLHARYVLRRLEAGAAA